MEGPDSLVNLFLLSKKTNNSLIVRPTLLIVGRIHVPVQSTLCLCRSDIWYRTYASHGCIIKAMHYLFNCLFNIAESQTVITINACLKWLVGYICFLMAIKLFGTHATFQLRVGNTSTLGQ